MDKTATLQRKKVHRLSQIASFQTTSCSLVRLPLSCFSWCQMCFNLRKNAMLRVKRLVLLSSHSKRQRTQERPTSADPGSCMTQRESLSLIKTLRESITSFTLGSRSVLTCARSLWWRWAKLFRELERARSSNTSTLKPFSSVSIPTVTPTSVSTSIARSSMRSWSAWRTSPTITKSWRICWKNLRFTSPRST